MSKSWVIGSSKLCDIVVDSEYVSSQHCRLSLQEGRWEIEDCGSTNGTFVNGKRTTGVCRIQECDRVTLGQIFNLPWLPEHRNSGQDSISLPTDGNKIIIGRSADCNVVIDAPMISNFHAEISHTSRGWIIRDLGSTNGTFYEGVFVGDRTLIQPDTTMNLGSYKLFLCLSDTVKHISCESSKPILAAKHITIHSGKKCLIRDISMIAHTGELIAIMGSSGAGKSTLLASLAGCLAPSEGHAYVANTDVYKNGNQNRGEIGFVPQDDILHRDLTVEAALQYTAMLRLPTDFSKKEIHDRVNETICRLGLNGTEQTLIGRPSKRGISGGQRKRVSIASELITEPPVLLLDEPTSGLSSNDSLSLIRLLRLLANQGKTIVLTIHQPSIEILELFDSLAVISRDESTNEEGRLVWYGPAYPDAAEFFEPHAKNISRPDSEAILRGLAMRTTAEWLTAYSQNLASETWGNRECNTHVSKQALSKKEQLPLSIIFPQFKTLVSRMLKIKWSDKFNTFALLAQAPIIATLIALVLGHTTQQSHLLDSNNYQSVAKGFATASFLIALASIWFGCSNSIREIVSERNVYKRERLAGLSQVAYVASKLFVFSLLCSIQCVILVAIVSSGCGFKSNWYTLITILFLAANIGVLLGLITSSLAKTTDSAAALLPIVILPLVILGGSLVPISELSPPAKKLTNMMPSRWAFEGIFISESDSQPLLVMPDKIHPTHTITTDMAEPWFPISEFRAIRAGPLFVLFALWTLGLNALALITKMDGS